MFEGRGGRREEMRGYGRRDGRRAWYKWASMPVRLEKRQDPGRRAWCKWASMRVGLGKRQDARETFFGFYRRLDWWPPPKDNAQAGQGRAIPSCFGALAYRCFDGRHGLLQHGLRLVIQAAHGVEVRRRDSFLSAGRRAQTATAALAKTQWRQSTQHRQRSAGPYSERFAVAQNPTCSRTGGSSSTRTSSSSSSSSSDSDSAFGLAGRSKNPF